MAKRAVELSKIEKELETLKRRYSSFIEERERKRRKMRDVHFSEGDREVLIQSIVIGGLIENMISHFVTKVF